MKGRKRHIITDTLGNLLHVKVHPANWHDTTVGGIVFEECLNKYPTLLGISADSGYRGTTVTQVTEILNKTIDVVAKGATSWIVLPMRWVVERTFAWINTCRRLSKDYELSIVSAENFIRLDVISIIIKRF